MAKLEAALMEAMRIDGALGAAVVDYSSGMALGTLGSTGGMDLNVAAAGNTDLVRALLRTIDLTDSAGSESIDDILVTLTTQYHMVLPAPPSSPLDGLFLYLVLDRDRSNLAMARHLSRRIIAALEI